MIRVLIFLFFPFSIVNKDIQSRVHWPIRTMRSSFRFQDEHCGSTKLERLHFSSSKIRPMIGLFPWRIRLTASHRSAIVMSDNWLRIFWSIRYAWKVFVFSIGRVSNRSLRLILTKMSREIHWLLEWKVKRLIFSDIETEPSWNSINATVVYEEPKMKLLVVQQRGHIVSGKRQEFVDELLALFKNEQLKEIIVLTAFNAVERNDAQLTGWETFESERSIVDVSSQRSISVSIDHGARQRCRLESIGRTSG